MTLERSRGHHKAVLVPSSGDLRKIYGSKRRTPLQAFSLRSVMSPQVHPMDHAPQRRRPRDVDQVSRQRRMRKSATNNRLEQDRAEAESSCTGLQPSKDELPNRLEQDRAEAAVPACSRAESRARSDSVRCMPRAGRWRRTTTNRCDGFGWLLSGAMRQHKVGSDWRTGTGRAVSQDFVPPRCG